MNKWVSLPELWLMLLDKRVDPGCWLWIPLAADATLSSDDNMSLIWWANNILPFIDYLTLIICIIHIVNSFLHSSGLTNKIH